jgi:hypothetical protein
MLGRLEKRKSSIEFGKMTSSRSYTAKGPIGIHRLSRRERSDDCSECCVAAVGQRLTAMVDDYCVATQQPSHNNAVQVQHCCHL